MWEKLTPDDIAQVKHNLSLIRAETLSRHAQELNDLDAERVRIEELERLIAVFAEKYAAFGASSLQPTTAVPEARQAFVQEVSPNFGIPLRRIVGR